MSKETGFHDLPLELQEYIFSFVPADNCINTAKVSSKWLDLTLSIIREIPASTLDDLNDLAEFVNQKRQTNYDGVSLLTLMPRLQKLGFIDTNEMDFEKLIPVLSKLKVLRIECRIKRKIDFKALDVQFERLIEFTSVEFEDSLTISILEVAPKMEILTIERLQVTQAWQKRIPETVKQFTVNQGGIGWGVPNGLNLFEFLFKNPAALEKFEFKGYLSRDHINLVDFSMVPNLKTLTLDVGLLVDGLFLRNAFQACRRLEKVETYNICVTKDWYKAIPPNVKSLSLQQLHVRDDLQEDFCFDYLFENLDSLRELEIREFNCTGLHYEKFRCGKAMWKLHLGNLFQCKQSLVPFSKICLSMIRYSSLVNVSLAHLEIDKTWENAVPATVEHFSLNYCCLNHDVIDKFSPQFICTAPSNMKTLVLSFTSATVSPYKLQAMDIDSFQGMSQLTTLSIHGCTMSSICLKSVLKNCQSVATLEVDLMPEEFLKNLSNVGKGHVSLSLKTLKFYEGGWRYSRRHFQNYFPNVESITVIALNS